MYILRYTKPFDERHIDQNVIRQLIRKHEAKILPELRLKRRYYDGRHKILKSKRKEGAPNAKPVCNHAKDIADTSSGYFMGAPISYDNTADHEHDIAPLLEAFDIAEVDETDSSLALDASIYGIAYEYIYVKQSCLDLRTKTLEPESTFLVKDGSIEQTNIFGVYYYRYQDDTDGKEFYKATIVTENLKYEFNLSANDELIDRNKELPEEHYMGGLPIVEYRNNRDCIGDFEQQIGLIDAYNELMADRVNDKKQFIDALLVLYGSQLGDDGPEAEEAAELLRKEKILELPEGAKAEYLVRTLDEAGTEVLRKALKEDIYTFSHIPNLSDENFAGNSSGVAMEFKLLGLEMHTKIKTRYFTKGLHKRIKLFCNFLNLTGLCTEAKCIVPKFSRSLPKNLMELSQIVTNLKGSVSLQTLLHLLPFVEDPRDELENVAEENEKSLIRQQEHFGNKPPPEDEDE